MLSSDKNIEILTRLIKNLKHYIELRIEILQLNVVSKLSLLVSALIAGAIIFCCLSIAMLILSLLIVTWLTPILGSIGAYAAVATFYLLLALLTYRFQNRLITQPIIALFTKIFYDKKSDK